MTTTLANLELANINSDSVKLVENEPSANEEVRTSESTKAVEKRRRSFLKTLMGVFASVSF